MFLGNIINQLLDEHCLADSRATEKADLTTFQIRLQKVNDLDAGVKHFLRGLEILELRRLTVYRQGIVFVEIAESVNGIPDNVHDTASDLRAGRHRDRSVSVHSLHSASQTVCRVHSDTPYSVFTDMLLNLNDQRPFSLASFDIKSVVNTRKLSLLISHIEMDIHHRSDDLGNVPYVFFFCHFEYGC